MCCSQDWVQPNKYFLKIKLAPTARRFCAPVLLSFCFSPGSCLGPHPAPASMASPVTPGVLLRSGCGVADLPPRPKSRPALLVVQLRHPCLQSRDPVTKAPVLSPIPSIPGPVSSICSSYHLLARSFVSRKQEHGGRNASRGPGTGGWLDRQKQTPGSLCAGPSPGTEVRGPGAPLPAECPSFTLRLWCPPPAPGHPLPTPSRPAACPRPDLGPLSPRCLLTASDCPPCS